MEAALRSLMDWYARAGVDVPQITPSKTSAKYAHKTRPAARPNIQNRPALDGWQNTRETPSSAPVKPSPKIEIDALIKAAANAARKANDLAQLRGAIDNFDAGRLSDNARGAVFARGNPAAALMIIGDAPSPEDDLKSAPLMGREGTLLSNMLGAIGLGEDDYYLTLCVNWRLPQNRMPKPAEIDICRPFLRRHIELAAPSHVLMLGSSAMSALIETDEVQNGSIMKHHGQWQSVKSGDKTIPALPIYHPAFLLKQADLKKDAWQDLLTLKMALHATLQG